MSVIEEIAAERRRQVEAEGWTPEHDDDHVHGQMARAAGAYAQHAAAPDHVRSTRKVWPAIGYDWPWTDEWWKPKDRRRDLVRAAALIIAEIERLDRAAAKECAPACPCDPNEPLQNTCEPLACWSKEG